MKKSIMIGGLAVVLLLLCLAIVGVLWFSVIQLRGAGFNFNLVNPVLVSAEGDEEKRLPADGAMTLNVENDSGAITVVGGTGEEIVISMHKTAYGETAEKAQQVLDTLKVEITPQGKTVKVKVPQTNRVSRNYGSPDRVDFTITVPVTTSVNLETSYGDVSIRGTRGEAVLRSDFGDIDAQDLAGGLEIRTQNGKVTALNVQALEAKVSLFSSFGDLTLKSSAAEQVTMESSNGRLTVESVEITGDATLNSDFGDINFDTGRAQNLNVKTQNGKVELNDLNLEGKVTVVSNFGDITLGQIKAASYDLDTDNGTITQDGAGGSLKAHSDFGNIKVLHGEKVNLDLSTSNGFIEYTGTLGAGPHTFKSDFGKITLTLPKDVGLDIDLKTDFGKVKLAMPVTLSGDLDEKHWVGTVNGGGISLTAQTNNGDIRIEVLNP